MAAHKAARVEGAASASHGGPQVHREDANLEDDGVGGSINALFLLSGPRGGVIDPRTRDRQLRALADVVDDAVFDVLCDAWDSVAVPADRYWRCPQTLHGAAAGALATLSRPTPTAAATAPAAPLRVPDPRRLHASFYASRVEALAARGYAPNRGLVPVALDRKSGSGSKAFNVLPVWSSRALGADAALDGAPPRVCSGSAVADFVAAVPHPQERNLYVLVDEDAPVDPYFDIDFACDPDGGSGDADAADALALLQQCSGGDGAAAAAAAAAAALSVAAVEHLLLMLLTALRREVEAAFHAAVEECVVLTSSFQLAHCRDHDAAPPVLVIETMKLSFHVHFRLAGGAALESVRELHSFMAGLRNRLHTTAADTSGSVAPAESRLAALMLRCVDFGVYSRWRAFRLPWNVKAAGTVEGGGGGTRLAAGVSDDLLAEQLLQLGVAVPSIGVGDAAPSVLQSLVLSSDAETCKAQRYLVQRLRQHFRFLLPVLPGATPLTSAPLHDFLLSLTPAQVRTAAARLRTARPVEPESWEVVRAWVMELACIVRDATPPTTGGVPLRLLRDEAAAAATAAAAQAAASAAGDPFEVPMPPRPRSVRVRVDDAGVKRLLAEVFWCIAPEYGGLDAGARTVSAAAAWESVAASTAVTAERITAHYEDSIRAYYVTQKQSKYCLRLHRCHRSTFAQLYLTFGSIKLRCYANDCCERCCVIPWEAPEDAAAVPAHHPGYPKYARLAALHSALFPPLSAEELVRRYGTKALQQSS